MSGVDEQPVESPWSPRGLILLVLAFLSLGLLGLPFILSLGKLDCYDTSSNPSGNETIHDTRAAKGSLGFQRISGRIRYSFDRPYAHMPLFIVSCDEASMFDVHYQNVVNGMTKSSQESDPEVLTRLSPLATVLFLQLRAMGLECKATLTNSDGAFLMDGVCGKLYWIGVFDPRAEFRDMSRSARAYAWSGDMLGPYSVGAGVDLVADPVTPLRVSVALASASPLVPVMVHIRDVSTIVNPYERYGWPFPWLIRSVRWFPQSAVVPLQGGRVEICATSFEGGIPYRSDWKEVEGSDFESEPSIDLALTRRACLWVAMASASECQPDATHIGVVADGSLSGVQVPSGALSHAHFRTIPLVGRHIEGSTEWFVFEVKEGMVYTAYAWIGATMCSYREVTVVNALEPTRLVLSSTE